MTILFNTPKQVVVNTPTSTAIPAAKITSFSLSKPPTGLGTMSASIGWIWYDPTNPTVILGTDSINLTEEQTKQLMNLTVSGKYGVETNRLLHLALKTLGKMPPASIQDDEDD